MTGYTKGILSFLGIGGLLYYFSRGQAAKNLKASFYNIKIGDFKGFNLPKITVIFAIDNPTNTPVVINAITGTLSFNGSTLSTVTQYQPITIKPKAESFAEVEIKTSILNLFYTLKDLIKNKKIVDINFNGSVNTSGLIIPINQTIKFNGQK